jgi:ATP-binding cassette subfamily F protein 2
MGKTPAQQNRLKAKQQGMSHDDVKKQQSKEAHEIKKLKNKDMDFGRAAGLKTKDQVAAQRLKDMNDPTTELGKATMRAARKAAKEQEEFLLRTKGISIRQKEVPEGVDPKTILCEYFKHGCCAKSADRCKFSHKMPDASRSGGSDATRKRDIYEDDEADEGDTMELWDQAKLESVIAKKHGAEKASSNATDIVCKHFLAAVETRKYGWFWACPGGDACKYKHKLPKGYVFKSDLVAMMREAALNRKSDQDDLREALEKLKDSGPGTPVTLEVFLDWKTRRVEARKEREAKAREERQKKGKFTGRELCESKDMTHASDEGSAQDDAEFKELRRLRKLAEEEEEARVAKEAADALEKAKASGQSYGEEELEYGISTDELANNAPPGYESSEYSDSEGEDGEAKPKMDDGKPKAVIHRRRGDDAAEATAEDADAEAAGGSGSGSRSRKKGGKSKAAAVPEGFEEEEVYESKKADPNALDALLKPDESVDEANLDPKELGRRLAEKKAREEAEAAALIEKVAAEKADKEARKAAKKLENEAKRAAKKAEKEKGKKKKGDDEVTTLEEAMKGVAVVEAEREGAGAISKSALKRTVTGVLASRPTSRDIKIINFSMGMNGRELVKDCEIEITIGRRYGLLGQNGCGKTNFLECIASREIPIPDHIDIYHLREEAEPTSRSAIQTVIDELQGELERLQKLEEHIMENFGPEDERLEAIYERLEEIDPNTFEIRAAELLHALGFSETMIHRATEDMSGGWRMRVALAKALFAAPTLLLLDEPTNHLDLEACVWLEGYLAKYKKCLILVSHSQDFLNGVCTHIIWLTQGTLRYYTGNYDTFQKTVRDDEVVQQKKYEKEQADIKHLKEFIASCGTYANARKQAESKQKIIDKMVAAGLTPPVVKERMFTFRFPDCDKVPPPVLPFDNVSFAYDGKKEHYLYENLDFGVDCDSRIALVGPNGAGKSTLLKLMTGELTPTKGVVTRHPALLIGKYHQHSVDVLDKSKTVLDFFMAEYPNSMKFKRDLDEWRAYLGRYGVSGRMQTTLIGELSEGQQCRLIYAMICMQKPNMLLLDEPTNHLDLECIDTLADAIKAYNGGVVLVSHDFRLIDQVAEQIWVCEDKGVKLWNKDIRAYKKHLTQKAEREAAAKKI